MASFMITGASRGFGLGLVRELLSRPTSEVGKIFACSRGPCAALDELAKTSRDRLKVIPLDVTDEQATQKAVSAVEEALQGNGLDVLINNAGIAQYVSDGVKSMDNLHDHFLVNVMGVHFVTRAFLPLLHQGRMKKVANISTTVGSIALASSYKCMPSPGYKISKTALNALTVQYALAHEADGFSFMALCPGWMKTELAGGDMADLTTEEAAKAALDIVYRPNKETNGKMPKVFVKGWEHVEGANRYDGKNAPW